MYAKIFSSLYNGSLRGNAHGILVFTNLLAHCDRDGTVDIHPRAIADEVGISVSDVRAALAHLEAPDPESRTPDCEGRRIVRMDEHRDWGWRVVNHEKYRQIRSDEDRREQNRLAQHKRREALKADADRQQASAMRQQPSAGSAHTDTDTDTTKPKTIVGQTPPDDVGGGDSNPTPNPVSKGGASAGGSETPSGPEGAKEATPRQTAREIITFLNEKTGRAYKPVAANLELIEARLREGYTPKELRQVIAKKCREWAGNEDMELYLRPETLFGRRKFAQYSGELVIPKEPSNA